MAADKAHSRPEKTRTVTYAIGDIHGRLDLLERLLGLVEDDAIARGAVAKIVFTGDYMDRGPHSCGVVERLIAGPRRPLDRFICLRGNHDDLFAKAVVGGHDIPPWAQELHRHTFVSYGGAATRSPIETDSTVRLHAAFLAELPLTHDDGINLFVHAGIRPGVLIDEQIEHDLIWIREDFLNFDGPLPRRVVHGHTIMGDRPVVTPNRVSIDTGAYRSGVLTAAVFDNGGLDFHQATGAPDREAIVREFLLSAAINDRTITPAMTRAFDGFIAARFDADELTRRLHNMGAL